MAVTAAHNMGRRGTALWKEECLVLSQAATGRGARSRPRRRAQAHIGRRKNRQGARRRHMHARVVEVSISAASAIVAAAAGGAAWPYHRTQSTRVVGGSCCYRGGGPLALQATNAAPCSDGSSEGQRNPLALAACRRVLEEGGGGTAARVDVQSCSRGGTSRCADFVLAGSSGGAS